MRVIHAEKSINNILNKWINKWKLIDIIKTYQGSKKKCLLIIKLKLFKTGKLTVLF